MNQALIISAIAITLLFAALGLLTLLVMLIGRGFQKNTKPQGDADDSDSRRTAAALAVAVALTCSTQERHLPSSNLGRGLEEGPGHWWFAKSR